MINTQQIITYLETEESISSPDLWIVLGPTASGKTKLAVELAKEFDAEIISADSRQVYRYMDIGTGKDIHEYGNIPYHLIDIVNPGDKYNISRFLEDFDRVYHDIKSRGKRVIVCGGTGFYLQALLEEKPFTQVPINEDLRNDLEHMNYEQLVKVLSEKTLPKDFAVDHSSRKRMIRAIEIANWLEDHNDVILKPMSIYTATVVGIQPDINVRRQRISDRLVQRLDNGMIAEVERLLEQGVSHADLEYYGLEYKYISYLLQDKLSYEECIKKLETEIHRYAKRQMTYFRKMEKDGVQIRWF